MAPKRKFTKSNKKHSMKVLTPEVLKLKTWRKGGPTGNQLSIPGFIRERMIMGNARIAYRRLRRAKRLGIPVEECPFPDPIWKKYHYPSVKLDDYDIEGCDNLEMLFDFGKDLMEQSIAAELAPDSGYPVNSSFSLPRSFLLDAIHSAASLHCLHSQRQAGKPVDRAACPTPLQRARPLPGFGDRYKTSLKVIFVKSKKKWHLTAKEYQESGGQDDAETEEEDQEDETESTENTESFDNLENTESNETTDNEEEGEEEEEEEGEEEEQSEFEYEPHPDDPDFDAILAHFLDTPQMLDPVPAYDFSTAQIDDFGADGLWTFDTSSLLAFGILAEEFCTQMIEAHLEYQKEQRRREMLGSACDSDSDDVILSSDIDSDVELELIETNFK